MHRGTKMSRVIEQFVPEIEDIEVQISTQDPGESVTVDVSPEEDVAAEETIITDDQPVILDEEDPHIEYMTVVVDDSGEQLSVEKQEVQDGYDSVIVVEPNDEGEGHEKESTLDERQIADILVAAAGRNFESSYSEDNPQNQEPTTGEVELMKYYEDMPKKPEAEESERRYKCGMCPKTYMDPTSLSKHRKTHTKDKPYKCKFCDRMFTDPSNLAKHSKTHLQEKPYKCDTCNKSFSDMSNLNKHEKLHLNAKPYKCFICQREFADSSNMRKHVKLHYGDRPFKCDVCDKAFADSSNLRKHKATHLEQKPYMCAVCQRTFADSSNLNKHMRIHEGKKPYQCEYCPKRFTDTSNLKKHTRIHTAEKPYVCGICGKKHSDKSNLTKHIKSHSDPSKTFMCGLCGRVFSSKKGVEMHAKSHTEEESNQMAIFTKEDEGKLIAISQNAIHYLQAAGPTPGTHASEVEVSEINADGTHIEIAEVSISHDEESTQRYIILPADVKQEPTTMEDGYQVVVENNPEMSVAEVRIGEDGEQVYMIQQSDLDQGIDSISGQTIQIISNESIVTEEADFNEVNVPM